MIRSNYDTILDKVPGGPTHMMHSGISQVEKENSYDPLTLETTCSFGITAPNCEIPF